MAGQEDMSKVRKKKEKCLKEKGSYKKSVPLSGADFLK
jgi:hypothetical protein